MTSSSPMVSGRSLAAALDRAGLERERRGQRGSHLKLRHLDSGRTVIVSLHPELAPGTLVSICRQAGWSLPEHLARRPPRLHLGTGRTYAPTKVNLIDPERTQPFEAGCELTAPLAKADLSNPHPVERCEQGVEPVARYPIEGDGVVEP